MLDLPINIYSLSVLKLGPLHLIIISFLYLGTNINDEIISLISMESLGCIFLI